MPIGHLSVRLLAGIATPGGLDYSVVSSDSRPAGLTGGSSSSLPPRVWSAPQLTVKGYFTDDTFSLVGVCVVRMMDEVSVNDQANRPVLASLLHEQRGFG